MDAMQLWVLSAVEVFRLHILLLVCQSFEVDCSSHSQMASNSFGLRVLLFLRYSRGEVLTASGATYMRSLSSRGW